jgi:hypothetical protein
MENKIPCSKIRRRERLKREESSTSKGRVYIPMRKTTILIKMIMKQRIFFSCPWKHILMTRK